MWNLKIGWFILLLLLTIALLVYGIIIGNLLVSFIAFCLSLMLNKKKVFLREEKSNKLKHNNL